MIPPCSTLSIIRYVSRVKWSNPEKGVAPSPTPQYSSYWKGSLLVALDYSRQLTLQEGRIREDLIENFKIINGISIYGGHSFFPLELEIYCQDRFQKLSLSTNWIFFLRLNWMISEKNSKKKNLKANFWKI